jgi:serine/threonine-protein kinase
MSQSHEYQPDEPIPGTVYKVVRLLGAGGMGTVYEVEDTSIGKRFVLKTLLPQLGNREDLVRRMQNEARTLARLNHTNIVEVFTAGVTNDHLRLPYYVMERLTGQTLRHVLEKRGRLELGHAYHIAIDLLEALAHAHDLGVIHRDVKPDNIFLHREPNGITITKLLDFGIMGVLDRVSRETGERFLGTLRYASPEQLRGMRPSPKMDIYAAGLVVYEMVAGRGPFDDADASQEVARAHLDDVAPLLSTHVSVPFELDRLLQAALSKHPDARPRDASSFATSLRNLKRALQVQTPAPRPMNASMEHQATAAAVLGPPSVPSSGGVQVQPTALGTMPNAPAEGTATALHVVDRFAPTGSIVVETPRMPQNGTGVFPLVVPADGRAVPSGTTPMVAFRTGQPHAQRNAPPYAPVAQTLASAQAPQGVSAPPPVFQWRAERAGARSEDAHVRTLMVSPPRSGAAYVPAIALGILALGAVVATAVQSSVQAR